MDCTVRNIIENLDQLRKNRKFTDVTILTKDNTSIPIHRNIVAPVSSYFDDIFERSDCNVIQINIDISGHLLNIIFDFIYTGIIDITYENAKALNKYANIFCIKNLEKSTEDLLIDNLNDETCLEYWRHAEVIQNGNLKIKCLCYILENPEDFFHCSLLDLTFHELENIISNEKVSCTQETLYKNIIRWIKEDYHRRHNHLKEFLRSLRISEFTITFITSEILNDDVFLRNKDIPDDILQYFKDQFENPTLYDDLTEKAFACIDENVKRANFCDLLNRCKEIIDGHVKTYYQQANAFTEMANNLKIYEEKIMNTIPHSERIINFGKIHAYEIDFPNKIVSPISKINQTVSFAASLYRQQNILLTGGGYLFGSKTCKVYTHSTKKLQLLSSMNERRTNHRIINLNDNQIYACGGNFNDKSVEYYDINSETWVRCLNVMNQKSTNFGLIEHGHSVYAFGGDSSSNIEHFDPRNGIWTTLKENSDITGITRANCVNDYVYCFGKRFGKLYDIRINDWIEGIMYPYNGENTWKYFDVIESNNLIYVFGYNFMDNETLYAYDYEEKFWTLLDIKIPEIEGTEFNLIKLPKINYNKSFSTSDVQMNTEIYHNESTSAERSDRGVWNFFKRSLFFPFGKNTEKSNKPIPNLFDLQLNNEKLIFISNNWIYNLNFTTNKLDPILKNYHPHMFSTCEFNKNYILLSGGLFQTGGNICKYYSDSTQEMKTFPSLNEHRIQHRTISLYDKIYACGGLMNNKFCEIFDHKSETWTRSAERMVDKVYGFGITTYGGCIYTFGGVKDTATNPSKTVEQFDPRIGKWIDLKSNSNDLSTVHCVTIDNMMYCIDRHSLHIFDARKKQWLNTIPHSDEFNFINFCIAEASGQIIMIGQFENQENCVKIFKTENNTLEYINFDVSDILLHNMNLIKIYSNYGKFVIIDICLLF